MISLPCVARARLLSLGLLLAGFALVASPAAAQLTPDQMAEMVLNSAKKAYNEKNYPVAVQRFREFQAKFGNHKDAPQARYGLALALLDGPDRDHAAALEQLQPLAGAKDFPDLPFVHYYMGLAQRGIGVKTLAQIAAQPQQAPQLRAQANQRFDEAAKSFALAAPAFAARVKEVPADAKELPADLEWAARSHCDQAEMLLRTLKNKEAQAAVAPFLKDATLMKSRYKPLALYYHGFSSFLLNDLQTAGRSLTQLAPFADPIFGLHARYLLGRTHQQQEENAEAATQYDAVLAEYAKQKVEAAKALTQPQQFVNNPEEKARLEALVREAPDYVARSAFYLGVIHYEGGKFADAQGRFAAFPKDYPHSSLLLEAQLRTGFCDVQLKEFNNAIKNLHPILEKDPRLADQAYLWYGKAQVGVADPAKPPEFENTLKAAQDSFRKAAEKAQQQAGADPEAKLRRGECLIELADAQQMLKQYREAAATCETILNEKIAPQRTEEVLLRRITALHLAGDYPASDQVCTLFQQAHPKSPLLPAVLFRFAENAYFASLAAEKIPDVNQRANELKRLHAETAKRYQQVIDKSGEFANVNVSLARHGLAMIHYRAGDYEKAQKTLETIPVADRNGDLALTPYLLADCMIRLAPKDVTDALAAGKLEENLKQASEMLEAYIGADPKAALVPDALLKLGLCQQRSASLLDKPPERVKGFATARATYERLLREFPKHPVVPASFLERAKCMAQQGDKNGAINELRRFTTDPLKQAPVAPMGVLELATLLREVNQPAEAVKVLAECRQQHEGNLAKDPERAPWVWLLQYHQAVALREAAKFPEARTLFEQVAKAAGTRQGASDSALRQGQCLHQEALLRIDAAQKRLATPNLKPEEMQAAQKGMQDAVQSLRDTVAFFEQQAEQWRQKQPTAEGRARMYYEAAWVSRALAAPEVAAVRLKMRQELLKKMQDEALKKDPNWKPSAVVVLPDVALSAVPVQPTEAKIRALYQTLIKDFVDLPLAIDARFELAELLAERDDFAPAIQLLAQAIDKEPGTELTEKIRLRLAAIHAAKGDSKAALEQFDAVAANPKSPLLGQAHYRAGECLLALQDFPKAEARLAIFRDNPAFHNIPGVSDRALLRLGHALALQKKWTPSRQAHETLVGRFPNSPWAQEGRYGVGFALQNEKQYDQAVNFYTQVANAVSTELGAKAQLQIGLCRLEQGRHAEASAALLVVPFTYDYPELNPIALCEAARALAAEKKIEQAEKLLQRVIKDHPQSEWAKVAKERLEALKKG